MTGAQKPLTPAQKRSALHRAFVQRLDIAGYQTSRIDIVQAIKRTWLHGLFAVGSSKLLDEAQLDIAMQQVGTLVVSIPTDSAVRKQSIEQRKRIIRLGKYVLGNRYGGNWFWTKLPEWTMQHNTESGTPSASGKIRSVTRLDDLTMAEACYVIRVMEQIEYRLTREGA